MKINEELAEALEKYFPKGDKRRGDALVLNAIANIELNKLKEEIDELNQEISELYERQ